MQKRTGRICPPASAATWGTFPGIDSNAIGQRSREGNCGPALIYHSGCPDEQFRVPCLMQTEVAPVVYWVGWPADWDVLKSRNSVCPVG